VTVWTEEQLAVFNSKLFQKPELVSELKNKSDAVENAIDSFNKEVLKLYHKMVRPVVSSYNETLKEAQNFVGAQADRLADYIDGRGEDWQTTDEGQSWCDLQEKWHLAWHSGLDRELVAQPPDPIDLDEIGDLDRTISNLEELPDAP
jgi:hypothetical protein